MSKQHVHGPGCSGIATIRFRDSDGQLRSWTIGASTCRDSEATLRAHFLRWQPHFEFVSATIDPERPPKRFFDWLSRAPAWQVYPLVALAIALLSLALGLAIEAWLPGWMVNYDGAEGAR